MDRVRFGRALGLGARQAARTLAEAAKAASAPSPAEPVARRSPEPRTPAPPPSGIAPHGTSRPLADAIQSAGAQVLQAQRSYIQVKEHTRNEAKSAGRSMLAPVRRAGSVLWLEITGTVFALFALFFAQGLWKLRDALHAPPSSPAAHKLYLYAVVVAAFIYFAISSFVRANRRGKRP